MKKLIQRVQLKMKNKQAFTLIELIVVIAIIAILVAILVPNVSRFIQSARATTADANAKSIFVAAQTYITDEYTAGRSVPNTTATTSASFATGHLTTYVAGSVLAGATINVTVVDGAVTTVTYVDASNTSGQYPD